jgi:carbon-monoxide dehydrogenase small subunit
VQQAFVDAGAVQCGFCTPGLVIAAHDLLRRGGRPSDAEVREALAGNLCRCTGYEKILDAVRLAADRWQDRAP